MIKQAAITLCASTTLVACIFTSTAAVASTLTAAVNTCMQAQTVEALFDDLIAQGFSPMAGTDADGYFKLGTTQVFADFGAGDSRDGLTEAEAKSLQAMFQKERTLSARKAGLAADRPKSDTLMFNAAKTVAVQMADGRLTPSQQKHPICFIRSVPDAAFDQIWANLAPVSQDQWVQRRSNIEAFVTGGILDAMIYDTAPFEALYGEPLDVSLFVLVKSKRAGQ